jgi:N-methylhydantoinase B
VESLRVFVSKLGTTHSSGFGLDGGYPGGGSNGILKRKTSIMELIKAGKFPESLEEIPCEEMVILPSKYQFEFRVGDVLETIGHGGGGFGDPLERDPQLVLKDVLDGCVSLKYAHDIYGVVLETQSLKVNLGATQSLRNELKETRLKTGEKIMPTQEGLTPTIGQTMRLGGSLSISEGLIRCSNCHGIISKASDNPKLFCLVIRSPFKKVSPWIALRLGGDNPELALLEYVCPKCGKLLFVDERRTSESDHWHDYRLEILLKG